MIDRRPYPPTVAEHEGAIATLEAALAADDQALADAEAQLVAARVARDAAYATWCQAWHGIARTQTTGWGSQFSTPAALQFVPPPPPAAAPAAGPDSDAQRAVAWEALCAADHAIAVAQALQTPLTVQRSQHALRLRQLAAVHRGNLPT